MHREIKMWDARSWTSFLRTIGIQGQTSAKEDSVAPPEYLWVIATYNMMGFYGMNTIDLLCSFLTFLII